MALSISPPVSSALQNDGLDVPVILQCRIPRSTNPKGHWGQLTFLENHCVCSSLVVLVCHCVYPSSTHTHGELVAQVVRPAVSDQKAR